MQKYKCKITGILVYGVELTTDNLNIVIKMIKAMSVSNMTPKLVFIDTKGFILPAGYESGHIALMLNVPLIGKCLVNIGDVLIIENGAVYPFTAKALSTIFELVPKPVIPSKYESYNHHDDTQKVFVIRENKGKHREHCLCYDCAEYGHNGGDCPIADELFQVCVDRNMVIPVWECPDFKEVDTTATQQGPL